MSESKLVQRAYYLPIVFKGQRQALLKIFFTLVRDKHADDVKEIRGVYAMHIGSKVEVPEIDAFPKEHTLGLEEADIRPDSLKLDGAKDVEKVNLRVMLAPDQKDSSKGVALKDHLRVNIIADLIDKNGTLLEPRVIQTTFFKINEDFLEQDGPSFSKGFTFAFPLVKDCNCTRADDWEIRRSL